MMRQFCHRMSLAGDCSESVPSSAASEDAIDLPEPFVNSEQLRDSVTLLLKGIGEDISREGLKDTPKRVAKAWLAASEGYAQSVHSVLGGALFHEDLSSHSNDSVVMIRDVDFASTSEHNLLPFYGRCHIAYIPRQGVVLGLSKVARLAKMFAKRFQDQQRFTCQVLEAFNAEVQPLGCAAIVEASHLGADLMPTKLTVASLGCFYAQPEVYMQEFAVLLGRTDLLGSSELNCHSSTREVDSDMCSASSDPDEAIPGSPGLSSTAVDHVDGSAAGPMCTAVEAMLREVGEDPDREGLRGSARRYVQHLLASTSRADGHQATAAAVDTSQKIAERLNSWQIESMQSFQMQFTSQCEHHLLPFHGTVQIIHLPAQSQQTLREADVKQIVTRYSKRLQIQERLTQQIAHAIRTNLNSHGLLVVCRAAHMCMVARGVEQHASTTLTSAAYGRLQTDHVLRAHMLQGLQCRG